MAPSSPISALSSSLSRMPFISALVRSTKRCVRRSCSASTACPRSRACGPASARDRRASPERFGERPRADVGDAVGEGVDVAVGAVREGDLLGEPVLRDAAFGAHQELVERGGKLGVARARDLAVVGDLADLPKPRDRGGALREVGHFAVVRDRLQRLHVVGHARAREPLLARHLAQAVAQPVEACEVEHAVAPLQHADGLERVRLEQLDRVLVERLCAPVTPKVPSFMWRPARPAIWASSPGVRLRCTWPSNLRRAAKATWSTSRLRPMPMASVATRSRRRPTDRAPPARCAYAATARRARRLRRRADAGSAPRWRRLRWPRTRPRPSASAGA